MKNKKKILLIILMILVLLIAVGITTAYIYMKKVNAGAETAVEVAENQRLTEVYVNNIQGNEMTYMETDSQKTATVYIPVGVPVTTASGGNTSFSRIEAGDTLQVLLEKDDNGEEVIIEIWIQGGQNGRANNRR